MEGVQEGQRVILRVGTGSRVYVVRIEEVGPDVLVVSAPIRLGHVVPVKPGAEVEIQYHHDDTTYGFLTVVKDFRPGHLPLITLARPTEIRKVQRRDHVRWPVSLPVVVVVGGEIEDREVTGRTVDLSGGGLAADLPGEWHEGQEVVVRLLLPRVTVEARARVVRVWRTEAPVPGRAHPLLREGSPALRPRLVPVRVALQFTGIAPAAREAIIRYIFHRQREFLRSGHVGRDRGAGR